MSNLSSINTQKLLQIAGGRLFRSLVSLILFQIILFGLLTALPQDLTELETNIFTMQEDITPYQAAEVPVWRQFLNWMVGFYRGDFGESVNVGGGTVLEILATRLPRTLLLLVPGTILGFMLGVWLGKRIAWGRRSWLEFALTLGGTAFYTSFPPWLAFIFIQVFAISLGWFPPEKLIDPLLWYQQGLELNDIITKMLITIGAGLLAYALVMFLTRNRYRDRTRLRAVGAVVIAAVAVAPWILNGQAKFAVDIIYHLILPLATLTLLSFGETMLVMKTIMSETISSKFVSTARAKGVGTARVRDQHAGRVAIIPVLSRFLLHIPYVIIGSFVLESIFFWDGMGQELVRAAEDNDLPVLMGVLSLVGVGILLTHVTLDLLTVWLDPRLREMSHTRTSFIERVSRRG